MRYAVADTGSNTIRLAVYDYQNGNLTQLYNEAIFANLAGHIENNRLTKTGIAVATDAILAHKEKAAEFGANLHVFATAAIRNAENTEEICSLLKQQTGISVDLISGEDEALLSFCGARSDFPVEQGVMADVGGGSSEVILFEQNSPVAFHSVPWGGLKAFKDFIREGLPSSEQVKTIRSAITDTLKTQPKFLDKRTETLCIVGGSVRAAQTLSNAFLGEELRTLSAIDRMLDSMLKNPSSAWEEVQRLTPKRAVTIAPALAIYSAIGHFFGAEKILFSDMGIKEGYVLSRLIQK